MNNLNGKRFALALFVVFAPCFAWVAYRSGKTPTDIWSALVLAYEAVPMVLFAVGIFVVYGWRLRIFQGWLVPFPDLNGTWRGTIHSTWTNPETGEVVAPIPAILTVKQSFIRISCVVRTSEMTSHSYLASFWIDGDEQIRKLGYSYQSSPRVLVQERSTPHVGSMELELLGQPVKKLSGTYWTTRRTVGEATFEFFTKKWLDEMPANLGQHPMGKPQVS